MATLLLVDDYRDALEVWSLYLAGEGYDVMEAPDGRTALELANDHLPDVIVLDLELPDLSGFEVAQILRLQESTRDIPLIAATGYSNARKLVAARDSGFDSVVVKPCNPQSLVAEVERLMASRHADAARQQPTAFG